jgi:hypothetical protein
LPVATRIGNAISAGAIAFYSDTKAYVIDRDKDFGSGDIISVGIYTFDPSDPGAGLTGPIPGTDTTGTGGQYLLDITIGTNGLVYTADGDNGEVLEIDPASDTLTGRTWSTSELGTSGLLPRVSAMNGNDLLYVANSSGSIDIINLTTGSITDSAVTGIFTTRIVYHAGTSSYYAAGFTDIHVFTAGGPPPYTATEVFNTGGSGFIFGMYLVGDLLFVTVSDFSTFSGLYVLDASTGAQTSYSPVAVGEQGIDNVTGVTLFE